MPAPTIETVVGPFTIVEEMPTGSGGMALVFVATVNHDPEAHTDTLPEKVALKLARVLPADQMDSPEQSFYFEALNNEVEMLKRARHPNVVRLFPIPSGLPRNPYTSRATELDGSPWFCAMEYLGGGSLEGRIRHYGLLPLAEAIEVAYQVGLALDHMHFKGMAHLDLKPDNVLFRYPVSDDWRAGQFQPVLIDFGIAAKTSKTGPQAGSVAFMPPERIRMMRGEIAPEQYGDQSKADSYGLGVLLYRMLTGKLPFEGLPRDELTDAIIRTRPMSPQKINPKVSAKIEELVMTALEKDPDRRPRIEEMLTRLDEAAVARPPSPPSARRLVDTATSRLPTPTLLTISGVVSVALILCFVVSFALGLYANNTFSSLQKPVPTLVTTEFAIDTPTPERKTPTPTLPPTPTPLPATPTATPQR